MLVQIDSMIEKFTNLICRRALGWWASNTIKAAGLQAHLFHTSSAAQASSPQLQTALFL